MRVWETVVVFRTVHDTDELEYDEFYKCLLEDGYIVNVSCTEVEHPERHAEWHDMLDHWCSWGKETVIMEEML